MEPDSSSDGRRPQLLPDASPVPQPQPQPEAVGHAHRGRNLLMLAGAIALLGAGLVLFDLGGGGGAPIPAAELQPDQIARIAADFAIAHGQLPGVDLSTAAAQAEVLRAMPLAQRDARQLLNQALAGERALVKISLWDNVIEDGDAVQVSSGGVTADITLTNAPVTIVMPYDPSASVAITGLRDGGGGITVAVELTTGPLPLPPMDIGETRILPLF